MDRDRQTVLIVDPDPSVLSLLGSPLESCEVVVLQVFSGRDALSILQRETFSLVMLETDLPDMSGFQLVQAIYELHPHQSCLFYTGAHPENYLDESASVGAVGLFSKTETPQRLIGQLLMAIKHGHGVQKLQRQHTAMSRKLEKLKPLERMVGRYAERWQVSEEEARRVITEFARSQRLLLSQLATISETRNVELQAARQELERLRKSIEDRLRNSEPGVLARLDNFFAERRVDPPAARRRIATTPST